MLLAQTLRSAAAPSSFRALRVPRVVGCRTFAAASAPAGELKKTPLYSLHVEAGAKMVPFAGYSMPVTYPGQSLTESHNHVRTKAGLFDVSHMVQHRFKGPAALPFLEKLTPSDLTLLTPGTSTLSVFLHPVTAGIVDDLIITMLTPEDFYVVTNAGCAEKDLAHIAENLATFEGRAGVEHTVITDHALLALQGPNSELHLGDFLTRAGAENFNLREFYFGESKLFQTVTMGDLRVARGGYTGEDGFEISIHESVAPTAAKDLLEQSNEGRVRWAGLGARDTLRLEAGMCLYGHDLDDTTTPIEAGLKWLIGKRRAMDGGYHGHETLSRQYNDWKLVERRRVGFIVEGAPAREGAEIISPEGEVIGKITSGCPSPTLGKNIAMGYVKSGFHKAGTELAARVRGRDRKLVVTKMPFVELNYYRKP
ncbi:glycine cleavage system T protein [Ascodesmis nigricans]|uniref:Aminomethyltransferase n=1 Tax=Ascodesmis nigricans TaxID=341454 RepID=A0A4S2MIW6_9PEZI|nr:glycine cleavage system T protein [Ascodesmis nigricans]